MKTEKKSMKTECKQSLWWVPKKSQRRWSCWFEQRFKDLQHIHFNTARQCSYTIPQRHSHDTTIPM